MLALFTYLELVITKKTRLYRTKLFKRFQVKPCNDSKSGILIFTKVFTKNMEMHKCYAHKTHCYKPTICLINWLTIFERISRLIALFKFSARLVRMTIFSYTDTLVDRKLII